MITLVAGALGAAGAATALAGRLPGRPAGAAPRRPPPTERGAVDHGRGERAPSRRVPPRAMPERSPSRRVRRSTRAPDLRRGSPRSRRCSPPSRTACCDRPGPRRPEHRPRGGGRPRTTCAASRCGVADGGGGRRERNGEPIASDGGDSARSTRLRGDRVPNDDGEPFRDGRVPVRGGRATGASSVAATIVIGVGTVDVWLLNNGEDPVCLVQVSPTQADFYEAFDPGPPLQPGEATMMTVALTSTRTSDCSAARRRGAADTRFSTSRQTYSTCSTDRARPGTTAAPNGTGGTVHADHAYRRVGDDERRSDDDHHRIATRRREGERVRPSTRRRSTP